VEVLIWNKFRRYIPLDCCIDYVELDEGISETVIVTEHAVACHHPKDDKLLSRAIPTAS